MTPIVAVNLFSVRDFCRTEAELSQTLVRLRDLGYAAVQVSGIPPQDPARVRGWLDDLGMTAVAAHDNLETLTQRPHETVAKLQALGCRFTALGFPGDDAFRPDRIPGLAEALTQAGRILASHGLQLGYHNHAQEFLPFEGTSMLEWIYRHTPADVLFAEPDVAWIQLGGGSPVAWIHRLKGRVPAIHLKDYVWVDGQARLCEVGHGNLDWPGIFAALRETDVPVWIVEQDDPVPGRDMFESLALSRQTIRRLGQA